MLEGNNSQELELFLFGNHRQDDHRTTISNNLATIKTDRQWDRTGWLQLKRPIHGTIFQLLLFVEYNYPIHLDLPFVTLIAWECLTLPATSTFAHRNINISISSSLFSDPMLFGIMAILNGGGHCLQQSKNNNKMETIQNNTIKQQLRKKNRNDFHWLLFSC